MRLSKFINLDKNILLEYLYDDGNLIGETYNILHNTKTGVKSFTSTNGSDTNNDLYNQLYKVDDYLNKYARVSELESDSLGDEYSFLQVRNFPTSAPIRYDTIKIHLPINYVFDLNKGFYIRVYTLDYDNVNFIEMSNYYFNITNIEQNYKVEYSSPSFIVNEKNWGKYLRVDVPSVTKISDQRVSNVTKENTINYNLSDGLGLSKTSPVFIDFHFIESIDEVNGIEIMNLGPKITVSVSQTPEFENLGVTIEKSSQGDFFLIFPTYNGSQGEFGIFLNESFYLGNRYYLEYQVDLYEKNTLTKTQTFIVTENFTEEIEYRPIIKFSTTTAAIDVTLRMIDSVDGTSISRKASYGMIQDEVSKYSNNLTKIDLTNANKQEVYNIKTILTPNTSTNPFGTKPILILDKLNFILYSQEFNVVNTKESTTINSKTWLGLNQISVTVSPFDNILKFIIYKKDENGSYSPYDLLDLRSIFLTIKNDKKSLDFPIYKDSSENNLELGEIVFKISESRYQELKRIYFLGTNLFYINAIDNLSNKIIVYSGLFLPFDISSNIQSLELEFKSSQVFIETTSSSNKDDSKVKEIRDIQSVKDSNKIIGIRPVQTISDTWKPFWKAASESIIYAFDKKNFISPKDLWNFTILLSDKGIIEKTKAFSSSTNDLKVKLILGYFKGLNLNPTDPALDFIFLDSSPQKKDILRYIDAGMSGSGAKIKYTEGIPKIESDVIVGEMLPKSSRDYGIIKSNPNNFEIKKSNNSPK